MGLPGSGVKELLLGTHRRFSLWTPVTHPPPLSIDMYFKTLISIVFTDSSGPLEVGDL